MAVELRLLIVTPVDGLKLTALAFKRFEPLIVRVNVLPCSAEIGASDVIIGAGNAAFTLNDRLLEAPLGVVTDTLTAPTGADVLILTSAVTWLLLALMLLTLMPLDGLKLTALALPRLAPLSVSVKTLPGIAEVGDRVVSVGAGAGALIVNGRTPDAPPGVVTEMLRAPVAADGLMVMVAVACDAVELRLLTVTPVAGLMFSALALERLTPLTVSVKVLPTSAAVGERELITGAALTPTGASTASRRPPA